MFQHRKYIYNQNKTLCNNGNLKNIVINQSEKCYYLSNFNVKLNNNKATISVLPIDSLKLAEYLINDGFNPVVLNLADISFPGGAVEIGGYAQEESLFCRSNYFKTLNIQTNLYPINGLECIYSKDVFVFRGTNLNFLNNPFYVSFIACAALKEPSLHGKCFHEEDYGKTFKKIEVIFQTAYLKGHNCVILSAFGCGAYKNPKDQMVEIFNKCIKIYSHLFEFIFFAILPKEAMNDRYINKQNDECNYLFFKNGITL